MSRGGSPSTARSLLDELLARGVQLELDGEQLRVKAPREALTAALREQLRARKHELLALLQTQRERSPLTGPQRQLWFVERTAGGHDTGLELRLRLRLQGELDRVALDRALRAVIARHEALRTRFEEREGEPVALIQAHAEPCWSDLPCDPIAGRTMVVALAQLGPWTHELLLRLHHIVCDGWSMAVLLEDLGDAYSIEVEGRTQADPLPVQPREVAIELDRRERSPEFAARIEAWVARLGEVRAIDLPLDRRRSARASAAGASLRRTIDTQAWSRAVEYARSRGATPFVLVATVLGIVLGRWTDARELWLGTPYANRPRDELARVVGMFVDTLLLRVALDDEDQSGDALLERVQAEALASFEHADLPLDRVIAALHQAGHARGSGQPGQPAVPNVMLNYVGFEPPAPRFAGLELELDASMPGSRFDLTVYVYPRAGALELELAYRSELFEAETIAALLEQLAVGIEQLPAHAAQPWRQLSSGVEPGDAAIAEATPQPSIATWLPRWPSERAAVIGADQVLDYATLRADALALAHAIHRAVPVTRSVPPTSRRVAIHARRTPALVVALLAVALAEASFVILDANYPLARRQQMLALARPSAWLALDDEPPPELFGDLPRISPPTDAPAVELPCSDGDPELYVAFTSGTTGTPRGIVGTRGPLVHFLADYVERLQISAETRFASLAGLGHDPSLRDVFAPLCVGATLCVPPREPIEMGASLGAWLDDARVTVIHLTPALGRSLAAHTRMPLLHLRRVCFGGDRLRGEDVRAWRTLAPNAELFNFYGATETPQAIAIHRITDADALRPVVPIGRGIDGVTLELVGDAGRPCAVGEVGEIVVRTPWLARVLDPDAEAFHGRYHTGDLGRRRHDGSVVCLGRRDDQVKIRGVRVELAEVEAVLRELAQAPAAALARERDRDRDDGERELIAYLVGVEATPALRQAVAARLPRAAVPSRWIRIDALPLTANAKLDRRALERLEPDAPTQGDEADQRPIGALEQSIAQIWAELLELPHVGRHDDFFAIGGHSLLAVRVCVRIHEQLGVELPVWSLFEHPSVAGCARAIEHAQAQARIRELPELTPLPGDQPAPASFAQSRLWVLHQLDEPLGGGAQQLSITHTLRLTRALDLDALDHALVELERRHDVLRTRFELVDGAEASLLQRVGPARERVLEREAPPPSWRCDLERGPIWRAWAWTHDDGEARLQIELHHIAGEAGSLRILARELVELYTAAREGRAPALPSLPLRYVDVAAWQHRLLAHPAGQRSLARWCERLAGVEPIELPLARPRPARQRYRGAWTERELPAALGRALDDAAARAGTTHFAVVLAALVAVLARWSGTADVTVGAPVGMRAHPATRDMLGPFLELVALRIDLGGDPTLAELLARVRARVHEGFAEVPVPFERIVQALGSAAKQLDRTPVFQVLLNVVDVGETEASWAQIGAERVVTHRAIARYDLAVYAITHAHGRTLAVLHDEDLFEPAQIHALLDHLLTCLHAIVHAPALRLSELALALAEPDAPVMPSSTPTPELPYARLSALAHAQPDALAIDMGGERLDYAGLLARVRALAIRLHRQGLAWPARVGLLVREDPRMAAGMFAALALGLTYVPLDPRLPAARLRELVADADLHALLHAAELEPLARQIGDVPRVGLDHVELDQDLERENELPPCPADAGERVAYLLYTSGSTGAAKAVMQSQRNLTHHALTYAARLGLGPGDRVSLVATHAFDAAVMDIYGALLSGACLCPIDLRGEALVELAAVLHARDITIFHATPTVVRHLLATASTPSSGRVRAVVLGGEPARREDALALAAYFGAHTQIINGLGPTECTLALQELVEPARLDDVHGNLPIGAPVPGVGVRLETVVGDQPALYGVGELVIESPYVALGYWRRPEASAAAFFERDGRRCYRTGDLARRLPGGRFGFVGRRGGFIKLRGHRIEPGEIEARLRALPGVADAAVDLREDELIGFFTRAPGQLAEPTRLLAALVEQLPAVMIPSRLFELPALPHTPTGKLDRRAVAQLPITPRAEPTEPTGRAQTSMDTPAQRQMLALWSEMLGHPPPNLDADFFASGGDSLAAARLVRALRQRFGVELPLARLFEGCSVAALARMLDADDARDEPAPTLGPARVRMLAQGEGEPWVFVLPPGERPQLLAALGERLGRPAWTIEPPSFGERGPLPSIEAITHALAEALATLALPDDRWTLAGVSNGGLLAWMLASTVHTHGPLVLLDSFPPSVLADRPWSARSSAEHLAAFAHALAGIECGLEQLHAIMSITDPTLERGDLELMFARYQAHAARVWQRLSTLALPKLARAPVLIEARGGSHRELASRWRELADVHVEQVAGTHLGMFAEASVDELATRLRMLSPA